MHHIFHVTFCCVVRLDLFTFIGTVIPRNGFVFSRLGSVVKV